MRRETGVEEMEWCFNYSWQLGTSTPATTELFTLKSSHVNQNFYTWPQGLFFCSTSCAQPQTACGHAPAAARESCALDVNSNSTKFCGKPLTSPCRPPESIGLVCLQPLIVKLDKEHINGQKCECESRNGGVLSDAEKPCNNTLGGEKRCQNPV